ncbi:MAG: MmgE/PrpD family protein [Betaproteobacteria bacterium]|nr:MmgE/PrpD family protein [Betaproteobacteria bacterium]
MTITDILAEFASGTSYRDVPEVALKTARRSLLDTIAVAIGAHGACGAREATDLAVEEGGNAASSLWAADRKVPPRTAVFVNSLMASALDFDSLHPDAVVHADLVTVPTAVAIAEARGASGQDLLAAIAIGDDLLCRLGRSTTLNSGWFYTSVYGPIAGAAVTAKLLGGSASRIAGAMGLGFLSSSGTQQTAVERSIGKRMHAAFAASAGALAGYLGARGLKGPREALEGRFGLYALYEKGRPEEITKDLGRHFENTNMAFKLYPSCQCNHAAIEGMLQLKREFDLEPGNVESVEVFVSAYMHRLVGAPFVPGDNPQVAAQFSIQYSIAGVLLFGGLGVREIGDSAVLDPRIRDIVSRVGVAVDGSNTGNYAPVRLKVVKGGGEVIERSVKTYRGNTDHPLSDADMKDKLAMCLEGAGLSVRARQIDSFFDAVMNVDQEPSVTAFVPSILSSILR